MSAPTPKPTPPTRWRCGKISIRSSTAKERATPIGSKSTCLPMVLEMRRRGIRIDLERRRAARDLLLQKRDAVFAELSEKLGSRSAWTRSAAPKWLAETFDRHGINYPRTEKGNPSFTAGNTGWMRKHPHWLPQLIAKADKYNKPAAKFLQNYILDHVVNGRIHAEIHPHRSRDGSGTRRCAFPIPIRRCSRCRRATRSWRR